MERNLFIIFAFENISKVILKIHRLSRFKFKYCLTIKSTIAIDIFRSLDINIEPIYALVHSPSKKNVKLAENKGTTA